MMTVPFRPLRILAVVLFLITAACTSVPASAMQLAALGPLAPAVKCASLATADISAAVGTSTHIDSAVEVPEGKPSPYCNVHGTIAPAIQFQVILPLNHWTQRFLQTGCGGFCGSVGVRIENAEGCTPATNGELVLAGTNMGHTGQMSDASAFKSAQERIDFAYRGQHLTTLAAKALIKQFYGQGPKYAYFSGCSDGGREALMEAQRFPNDFDGIIAGDPASNFISQNTFGSAWSRFVNTGPDGKGIFAADKLVLLHNAVLAQCDAADGVKDGLISDPLACHFKAEVIQCKAGQDPSTCLTPAQVKAVNEIYAGPHDAEGNRLAPGGMLPGSEANWAGPVVPMAGEDAGTSEMAESAYKYLAFETNPPATLSSKELKFDRASFEAATKLNRLYDATDPNLAPFRSHGGKLILYHGLADPAISPLNTILYYAEVQKTMGKAATDEFSRLYLFPGVSHCGGGQGPFHPDFLSAIMAWVEASQAPSTIMSASYSTDRRTEIGMAPGPPANQRAPGAAGPGPQAGPGGGGPGGAPRGIQMEQKPTVPPDRTFPIYAYPVTTKYRGAGNIDDDKSFGPGPTDALPDSFLTWLGSSEYVSHHAVWCDVKEHTMSCKATP